MANKYDKILGEYRENDGSLDATYLRLDATNDPLTGELTITPSSGTTALKANQDIVIKAGKKLIFDGA